MSQDAAKITARDLLNGFLELRRMTPNMAKWSEEALSDNPPRLYRFQQLVVLFRAYEIDWNPSAFVKGKFIQTDSSVYGTLLRQAGDYGVDANRHQLPDCFEILLEYREQVEGVLSFSSGLLEASGLYLYAHKKAGEMNRIIRDKIALIDDLLVAFISPAAKTFTLGDLVRDYGYPDVDLFDIDIAWF